MKTKRIVYIWWLVGNDKLQVRITRNETRHYAPSQSSWLRLEKLVESLDTPPEWYQFDKGYIAIRFLI
ncbi:MAG: hypothetical protein ACXAC2_13745 [Candidatus Kariarchaeaceae archaeon]|jgi:hypothetical protein